MTNKLNKLKKRLHKGNQQLARGETSERSVLDIMDEVENRYRSDTLEAVHETMKALRDIDAISDQAMCEFDDACLDEEFKAAIEEGMEDLRNGRVHDAKDVFDELMKDVGDKKSPRRGW